MRAILAYVLAAMCLFGADTVVEHDFALRSEKRVALQWHFHDEWRVWLAVNGYGSDFEREGYHPSFTYIVSDYQPMVKKIGAKYQITFKSEIANDIP
jgi:hypothetical protein